MREQEGSNREREVAALLGSVADCNILLLIGIIKSGKSSIRPSMPGGELVLQLHFNFMRTSRSLTLSHSLLELDKVVGTQSGMGKEIPGVRCTKNFPFLTANGNWITKIE